MNLVENGAHMKVQKALDVMIPMSLISLGVLTSAYGMSVVNEIPAMRTALINANSPKLVPMPEPVEFVNGRAVIVAKGGK
jgi:hypothetical protein